MYSQLLSDSLAHLRRQKVRKAAVGLILGVSATLVLLFLGLWKYPTGKVPLPQEPNRQLETKPNNLPKYGLGPFTDDSKKMNLGPYENYDDYQNRPDNERPTTHAQKIFGSDVKLASLWPFTSGSQRFAYAFYATKKEYLCNVLINFHQLKGFGVSAELALIYPKSWDTEYPSGSSNAIRKMLDKAKEYYGANLHPVELWITNIGDPTWRDSLTKLYVFGLTDYSRIIYLDSDGIPLNNMDHLFLAPQARIALPRAYWLDEGKLASHIMVIEPDTGLMNRVKAWVNTGRSGEGFDMEVINEISASSALILPHRRYAMLTGELRNTNHSRYLAEEGPDAEWNPHAEMSRAYYIHFSDWPMPKPWIKASQSQIERTQPACLKGEEVKCWNRQHWLSVYDMYNRLQDRACIN